MNYLDVAINQIIREQGIPHEWNSLIKDELNNLNIKNGLDRKNLTDIPFVTIDGEDAKDFDDAVFCSVNKSSYTLKVAIADVSSIVLPNTELDKEAFKEEHQYIFLVLLFQCFLKSFQIIFVHWSQMKSEMFLFAKLFLIQMER
jgi:ribonuclease R